MLVVHHLGISQSERIVWLCEELGIPYELRRYNRDAVTRLAPPEYKALHKFGTAPVITDGPLVLPESGAITQYIIEKYGDGRLAHGPDHPNFADYLFWLHFSNGSMMPGMMMAMAASRMADQEAASWMYGRANNAFAVVEERLGKVPYLAGDEFTAADIMMGFPLTTMRMYAPRDISSSPNLLAYLKRIGDRPAYRAAMAKAEPDMAPVLGNYPVKS